MIDWTDIVSQLVNMRCIELKPLTHASPKGGLRSNYTTNKEVWSLYPFVPERYGVLLKPNNILVIDIDYPDKVDYDMFPTTFTVRTGGGGFHLYYHKVGNSWDEIPYSVSWGEIKISGHVVGVGVTHEETRDKYSIFRNIPINSIQSNKLKNRLNRIEKTMRREGDYRGSEESRARENVDKEKKNPKKKKSQISQKKFTQRVEQEKTHRFVEVFNSLSNLIYSREYRRAIAARLVADKPSHSQRLWLVGFLKNPVDLDLEEVLEIIGEYNDWKDYDKEETEYQVYNLYERDKEQR